MLEHSRLAALCAVPTLMLIMSWVTVMLRCWVKKRILKIFTLDDWVMLLSLVIFTGLVGLQYRKTATGLGQHITELNPAQISEFLHLFEVGQIVYIFLTVSIKGSISVFLLRISIERVHKFIIYATLLIYISSSIFFIVEIILQCSPTAYWWDKTITGGTCVSPNRDAAEGLASAALITSTDLVYTLLPVWLIRNLQMDRKTKVSVAVILSMGLLSTAATCIRFPYIVPLGYSTDFTYDVYGIEIWSTIEPGLGITAASVATLRPLLRIFAAKVGLGSKEQSSGGGLQMPSKKRASPTFGAGIRGHIRSLSGRQIDSGAGIPPSASFTKLVHGESQSTASVAESAPRIRQRSLVLEHGWPEER